MFAAVAGYGCAALLPNVRMYCLRVLEDFLKSSEGAFRSIIATSGAIFTVP
jgi:hypothetical protein